MAKTYRRNLLAFFLLIALVAAGSLFGGENPERPEHATRLGSAENILLLAALLEEKGVDYKFDSGCVVTSDPASLQASLTDRRVRDFWVPKSSPKSELASFARIEEERLQEKVEDRLGLALGEETYRHVLIRLDCSFVSFGEFKLERERLTPVCPSNETRVPPEPWPLCRPLEHATFEVARPSIQIDRLRVLLLIETPESQAEAEAIRSFVAHGVGLDQTRGDELLVVHVPVTERLRTVRSWRSRKI